MKYRNTVEEIKLLWYHSIKPLLNVYFNFDVQMEENFNKIFELVFEK